MSLVKTCIIDVTRHFDPLSRLSSGEKCFWAFCRVSRTNEAYFADESTRREEHEAAYGLLSLSQKTSQNLRRESTSPISNSSSEPPVNVLNTEEIAHASKTNYAKNKILDDKTPLSFNAPVDLGPRERRRR
jgi:hypothetical protein